MVPASPALLLSAEKIAAALSVPVPSPAGKIAAALVMPQAFQPRRLDVPPPCCWMPGTAAALVMPQAFQPCRLDVLPPVVGCRQHQPPALPVLPL